MSEPFSSKKKAKPCWNRTLLSACRYDASLSRTKAGTFTLFEPLNARTFTPQSPAMRVMMSESFWLMRAISVSALRSSRYVLSFIENDSSVIGVGFPESVHDVSDFILPVKSVLSPSLTTAFISVFSANSEKSPLS